MQSVVLVVNPFASRVTEQKLEAVERELSRVAEVTTVHTEHPRHATELVSEAAHSRASAIVVFSGDGGFNEALNGLHAFSAGVGLDAEAVRRVNEMGRASDGRRPGDFAFALALVRALAASRLRLEPMLEVEGLGRAAFAFVANGSPYTYAKRIPVPIAPEAEFELGLDVVAPVRVRRRSLPRTAYSLLTGHPRDRDVLYGHDLDRVVIRCDTPMPLQADGEDLGDVQEVVFEAQRGAVAVLV